MSLLSPPPEPSNKYKALTYTVAALTVVLAILLYFVFRYYPEKKATERFFDALVAGNTDLAYQLWKPNPTYALKDFLADWGPQGYWGPVKSYKIEHATAPKGSTSIDVTVKVSPYSPMPDPSDVEKSRKTRVVDLWIESSNKSFSFPP